MRTATVLITGSGGLLGSTLTVILKNTFSVITENVDVSKKSSIERLKKRYNYIDFVIHTAAITDIEKCESNKKLSYRVNVEGTKNIVNFAKYYKARLVYISTSSIFFGKGNFKETDLPYPKNYYDLTKYLGELIVLQYDKSLIVRTNLIGIHPKITRNKNFAEWLVRSLKRDKDITLFTDVFINPLSNWTLSLLLMKIMQKDLKVQTIHIGSKDYLSKAAIGKLFLLHFKNYKGHIHYRKLANSGNIVRSKNMWLNTDLAQKKLKLSLPSIKEEVDSIFKHFNENS